MSPNSGFTKIQLKQLQTLFIQERKYTKSLLVQERKYTKSLLVQERSYHEVLISKLKRSLIRTIGKTKNELQQSIAHLATHSPTRKEFEELKEKVDFYHPEASSV